MYINASSAISFQNSFKNRGFSKQLRILEKSDELLEPDYSQMIEAGVRRRMGSLLKMALVCSLTCVEQLGSKVLNGIIIGTAIGSGSSTLKFLDKIHSSKGGLVSPTPFIVSTHNTMAGQISLYLTCHGYNMTHTQNSLSFEQALIDAVLCIQNGDHHILVGGVDEDSGALYNLEARLGQSVDVLASGAAFFIMSKDRREDSIAQLQKVQSFTFVVDIEKAIKEFLSADSLSVESINRVYYSNSASQTITSLTRLFEPQKLHDFQKFTGSYLTNSAVAMSIVVDQLMLESKGKMNKMKSHVLIINNLIPENLGLILLKGI